MKTSMTPILVLLLATCGLAQEQDAAEPADRKFDRAAGALEKKLEEAVAELSALREQIAAEKIPLGRKRSELEAELILVRREAQDAARSVDGRALELSNLGQDIKARKDEIDYLSKLFSDYVREFGSRLHVVETTRYTDVVSGANLAQENADLDQLAVFRAQAAVVSASIDRLDEAIGGARFPGQALEPDGIVRDGTFVLVGPTALFRSNDGSLVGWVEQRLNSSEPSVVRFLHPEATEQAVQLATAGVGILPFDPSLGDAQKIEGTEETLLEHVEKGGPVMIPIFAMAALALLIALYKWLSFLFIRKPTQRQITGLLEAVRSQDHDEARVRAHALGGPTGKMLAAGADQLGEPRELIEEIMFETVLTTRLRVQQFLPFIAICAASAPLLGLLGTVTGIINTFKMIELFGSSDTGNISGGISEALITTKFGLIVAIPSLLLHAFLSRKARGVIGQMEMAALAFVNEVGKTPQRRDVAGGIHAPTPTVTAHARSASEARV